MPNPTTLYVKAKLLNGRSEPKKNASIECRFDKDDSILATGNWSNDHHWIEVVGGETGTVWVYADYVSEYQSPVYIVNYDYKKLKIRSRPFDGKITGYLKRDKPVQAECIILGWAKTVKGWINMRYVEEY